MSITYQAFDHVTGSYILPDGSLDFVFPHNYATAQKALNAILAMLALNSFSTPDVEIFTKVTENTEENN